MPFCKEMITPQPQDIARVVETPYIGGRNIIVYSYANGKKTDYLSHVYQLDSCKNGQEFIYDPQGKPLAQFPLVEGRAHGRGQVIYSANGLEEQYFYYGEVFPSATNMEIVSTDGDETIIQLSAALSSFDETELKKTKLPNYIFNEKENIMMQTIIFEPVAQNTIIRPMAQAICIARGGDTVDYVDTATHEKKRIIFNDLCYLTVRKQDGNKWVDTDAYQVALDARNTPVQIRVDVNDVSVLVTSKTTLVQAMSQFRRKITVHNREMMRQSDTSRQYE